jgi:uncharacterized protein YidB (DUF937 family)
MKWLASILDFFSFKFDATPAVRAERTETQIALALLRDYFDANGGALAVARRFDLAGFASKVRSWKPGLEPRAINSVEALQMFGWKTLRDMSARTGLPVDRLRDLLAETLPGAIIDAQR